jgi:acetyl-CoA/propionyl-CoA carboxylase, biotin carboxylase, biotin carboxyl carrier protein
MFESVLIANRGEIAVRVARTLRRLEIESIAVFSDADADAPHVRIADRAVRIGPVNALHSYLDVERIIAAALSAGAKALHPGYGFLSERADFARACNDAGIVFVGPSPEAIALLGDKAAAKRAAAAAGVPVVPGLSEDDVPSAPVVRDRSEDDARASDADGMSERIAAPGRPLNDEQIVEWAQHEQLPLLLKAAAGGGGKGMRRVERLTDLPQAIATARREAHSAFGDDRLIVERCIEHARHIEVQVIADGHGNVLHLGERECSLQRRHQKVIEEAPSPVVGPQLRARLGAAAVALARGCGYTNAGTVELIADRDRPESFYFLEMNARLQVEHPVTEAVTGLDLVELQLRVAAGQPLGFAQEDVRMDGHAIEARIYAEDPAAEFMPSTGRIAVYREPQQLRIDSGIGAGTEITSHYDPMLAKAIAHAPDRETALSQLESGLREMRVLGPTTNLPWLLALLRCEQVRSGIFDTMLLERLGSTISPRASDVDLAAGLALVALLGKPRSDDPWDALDGWRLDGRGTARMRLDGPTGEIEAHAEPSGEGRWRVGDARVWAQEGLLRVQQPGGSMQTVEAHRDHDRLWLIEDGVPLRFAAVRERAGSLAGIDSLQAPMPGVVLEVRAQAGSTVTEGEVLVVLESMKMELSVASPEQGIVAVVHVAAGDRVAQGEALLELEGETETAEAGDRDTARTIESMAERS